MGSRARPAMMYEAPEVLRASVSTHEEQALQRCKHVPVQLGPYHHRTFSKAPGQCDSPVYRLCQVGCGIETSSEVTPRTPSIHADPVSRDLGPMLNQCAVVERQWAVAPRWRLMFALGVHRRWSRCSFQRSARWRANAMPLQRVLAHPSRRELHRSHRYSMGALQQQLDLGDAAVRDRRRDDLSWSHEKRRHQDKLPVSPLSCVTPIERGGPSSSPAPRPTTPSTPPPLLRTQCRGGPR